MLETKKKFYRVSEIASMLNFSKEMLAKNNNVLEGVDITYKAKNLYDSQIELINRLSESERQLVLDYAAGLEQDKGNVKVYPK
jgi:hypothetical protein